MSDSISDLRAKCPVVHCITNYVTVNDVANAILAIGGSPTMADAKEEVADILDISNALVINIGTLNNYVIDAMLTAGRSANEKGVPVVLDPVGASASQLRKDTVRSAEYLVMICTFTTLCATDETHVISPCFFQIECERSLSSR